MKPMKKRPDSEVEDEDSPGQSKGEMNRRDCL